MTTEGHAVQTSNICAIPALAILLGACLPGDEVYEDFQKYADSISTTGTANSADPNNAGDPSTTDDLDPGNSTGTMPGTSSDFPPDVGDEFPEIHSFTIEPPVITEAGPVIIGATFSKSVTTAALFEKRDGETHLLEVIDPASALTYEYAVTSDNLNGEHELYLQAFDADERVAQATSSFEVALPPGGTPVWHHVDYNPDDPAILTYGADVAVQGDGVVIVGVRIAENRFHLLARRYSGDGELEWTFESEDEVSGEAVAVDDEGNILIVGIEYGAKSRMWVHKLDAQGVPLWSEPRRGMPGTTGFDVAVDSSGQIYVVGTRTVTHPDDDNKLEDDAMIWEYRPDGAMEAWADYDDNSSYLWSDDRATGITALSDGRIALAGDVTIAGENNEKLLRAAVLEYVEHDLFVRWVAQDAPSWSQSSATSIVSDALGGFALAGWTKSEQPAPERIAVRGFDASFSNTWSYPGFPEENPIGVAYSLTRDPEGRFPVGAWIESEFSQDARVFSVKQAGGPAWFPPYTYNGSDSGNERVYGVAADTYGYVYFTGSEPVDGKARLILGKIRP